MQASCFKNEKKKKTQKIKKEISNLEKAKLWDAFENDTKKTNKLESFICNDKDICYK